MSRSQPPRRRTTKSASRSTASSRKSRGHSAQAERAAAKSTKRRKTSQSKVNGRDSKRSKQQHASRLALMAQEANSAKRNTDNEHLNLQDENRELFLQVYQDATKVESQLINDSLDKQLKHIEERYEILSQLGEGALKKVYLAYDLLTDREVAMAVMKPAGNREDFLNEARFAAKLDHPNIATVHDMGYDKEGEPFFVMKLLDGKNLSEVMHERRKQNNHADVNWILSIFLKVCDAVAFAHTQGILHLDIKPENVQVDDFGSVFLCDWGISKRIKERKLPAATDGGESKSSRRTQAVKLMSRATLAGEIRGTPGFMAPEQRDPRVACDERTDIYGLGALLITMFCGSPDPGPRRIKVSGMPPEIQAICQKAMERSRRQRYSSMSQLIQDIEKYTQGLVTMAENANPWDVTRKWLLRNKKVLSVIVLNVLLLLTALSWYVVDINHRNDVLDQALTDLKLEQSAKVQLEKRQADDYYQQSLALYLQLHNTSFDLQKFKLAFNNVDLALSMGMQTPEVWILRGNLEVLKDEFQLAMQSYKEAGEQGAMYVSLMEKYNGRFANLKQWQSKDDKALFLVRGFRPFDAVLSDKYALTYLYEVTDQKRLREFAMKVMAMVNNVSKVEYTFESKNGSLMIKTPGLREIWPIKTLRAKRLTINKSRFDSVELKNLKYMPLMALDLSFGKIQYLGELDIPGLKELNLEGNPCVGINRLSKSQIRLINVTGIPADLSTLKRLPRLEIVICSEKQAEQIRPILLPRVRIITKKLGEFTTVEMLNRNKVQKKFFIKKQLPTQTKSKFNQ